MLVSEGRSGRPWKWGSFYISLSVVEKSMYLRCQDTMPSFGCRCEGWMNSLKRKMWPWALCSGAIQSLHWVFQEVQKEVQRFSSHVFLRQTDDDGADIREALGVEKRRSFLSYSYQSLQFVFLWVVSIWCLPHNWVVSSMETGNVFLLCSLLHCQYRSQFLAHCNKG